jgi:uncharacterized protein YjbI with pentapeptide repeats
MDQKGTIALFERCEAARNAALDEGKSESEAHEAAKSVWNHWAEAMVSRRKALVSCGQWKARKAEKPGYETPSLEPLNEETRLWMEEASVDFSRLDFRTQDFGRAIQTGIGTAADLQIATPAKPLAIKGDRIAFDGFIFPAKADFYRASFFRVAGFTGAQFLGTAEFWGATFSSAGFDRAKFFGDAWFRGATWHSTAWFEGVIFEGIAGFGGSRFERYATFAEARFRSQADFTAVGGGGAFDLAGAVFDRVPDFIQAHFEEAPRLDNVRVEEGLTRSGWGLLSRDRDRPARFRALKRLAFQGHDLESQLDFFSREVRTARFASDWPLPWPFWRSRAWGGFLRFWFGCAYEVFGGFGSSAIRPLLWWLLTVAVAAVYFLGQNVDVSKQRVQLRERGASAQRAYVQAAYLAWRMRQTCFVPEPLPTGVTSQKVGDVPAQDGQGKLGPLVREAWETTTAPVEALQLAFRNGFILIDNGGDAVHRSYGCLYGVELYGGSNPVAFVPPAVSLASMIQKLVSGGFIFLFGLALRNMLKMK